jgi:hypothetical protein
MNGWMDGWMDACLPLENPFVMSLGDGEKEKSKPIFLALFACRFIRETRVNLFSTTHVS